MNLAQIKLGFQSYLEDLNLASNNKRYQVQNPSVSIFQYSNEFKDYLVEEVGADSSIFSKSVTDILDMEFKNGKLVDPEEETGDTFIKNEEENNVEDSEDVKAQASTEETDTEENIGLGLVNEALANEKTINHFDTDKNGDLNQDEANIFLGGMIDAESGEFSFDKLFETMSDIENDEFSLEKFLSDSSQTKTEDKPVDKITELLNKAYDNKTVSKTLDEDKDGELSDEEKTKFQEFIKGFDGDDSSLSEEDIKEAVTKILDGEFSYEEAKDFLEEKEEDNEEELEQAEQQAAQNAAQQQASPAAASPSGSSGASPAGGVSGASPSGSSFGGTSSPSSSSITPFSSEVDDSMSLEKLESEKKTKEGELKDAQEGVNDVYSGENAEVKKAEEDCQKAKEKYDEAVENDENISDELKQKRTNNLDAISKKEDDIDKLNISIHDQDSEITGLKTQLTSEESNLEAIKSSLSELRGQKSEDSDTNSEISSKISTLEKQQKAAETKIGEIKQKISAAEAEKTKLEGQLTTAEGELTTLNKEKTDIEAEIEKVCKPETKEAMKAYNDAKTNVDTVKEAELKTAKATESDVQKELDDINKKIDDKKAEQTKEENSIYQGSLDKDVAAKLDKKLGNGFAKKVEEVAKNIGCDPADLVGMMYSESGLTTTAVNPNGGATGLIQFMPSTAQALGTTTAALKNMSAIEQMDYVQKFYEMNGVSKYKDANGKISAGTLYTLTFLPAYADREVLCTRGQTYYNANYALDTNGDGKITKSELGQRVQNKYQEFLKS